MKDLKEKLRIMYYTNGLQIIQGTEWALKAIEVVDMFLKVIGGQRMRQLEWRGQDTYQKDQCSRCKLHMTKK